ncbi:MAG: winged helix-turn-helix transcriptional regulator [Candidatus Heimdallarchaeota archaeon]|nr:MAG: winged helix-turn-helix transcriptional regulator [Candidatus Heimdallarchaeota archaeon]
MSRTSKKVFQPTKEELIASYEWGQLLQNDTRISILMYLRMNDSLSFSQLTHLLGKSRSTVHHHLQKMIKGGIVREIPTSEPRSQFDPKFYELTPRPLPPFSFHNIHELPIEKQEDALLTTTKVHQSSLFYSYQILDLFKLFLDKIENENLKPSEFQDIVTGTARLPVAKNHDVAFKDIFYFSTQVNEQVYNEYRDELEKFHEKLIQLREKNEKIGGDKRRPYFIFHVSAPLGKPFMIRSDNRKD